MIDLGLSKLALIGVVALVVIGPEKLPRVARTVGNLLGRAQRYVADVKAEVNRSFELEELRKMKSSVEDAAHNVEQSVSQELSTTAGEFEQAWSGGTSIDGATGLSELPPVYKHPKKNWRVKRAAVPQWYKQRAGIRARAQSGAARVARYRPPRAAGSKATF